MLLCRDGSMDTQRCGSTKVWKHEGVEAQKYGSTKVTFSGQLTTDIGRLDQLKFINEKKRKNEKKGKKPLR